MSMRRWYLKNPNLHSRIAGMSVIVSVVAGIAMIVSQEARQGGIDPVEFTGVLLLLVTGVAFSVYARLSKNRLRADIARRERVERALRESEQKYRDLVENAPVGIVVSSFDGRVVEVNDTLIRMHGYETKGEFAESNVSDRFYDLKDRERWVAQVWGTGKAEGFEVRTKRKDGSLFWSSLSSIPRVTDTGEQQLVTMVQNITERRNAEEALAVKTALLEAQTESSQEGILTTNEEGRIALCNDRFREMLHVPEELTEAGATRPILSHAAQLVKDPEPFLQRVKYLAAHREEKAGDTIDMKDGRVLHRYTSPLVDGDGVYLGRVWYFRDITEPRKTRAKLKLASEEWRRTFDSISDAVSIQDKDFRLVRVNRAFSDMFKKEPQELLGMTCHGLVHGTACPRPDCSHHRTMRTGQPAKEEFFEPHLGIFLEVSTSPLFDDGGGLVGTVHVARDVSKRHEMEQQLMLADRMVSIGELASGVAHELNNPLTTVIGFSELLMEKEIPDDIRKDLDLICSESKRAAGIVSNLLTFARRHDLVTEATRIDNVIENVLRLRDYEQRAHNISVVTRITPDLPEIKADFFQLQQVFLNLMINAEFFMTEAHHKGVLTVTAEQVDGMIRVSVADDGPGISGENLSHLFNPFFTTKEVGKGTGLGLSICHGIVTEHGGRIHAESRPGEGATFVVELPVSGSIEKGERSIEKGGQTEISGGTFGRSNTVTGALGKNQGGLRL